MGRVVPFLSCALIALAAMFAAHAQDEEMCVNPKGFTLNADALVHAIEEHARWVSDSTTGERGMWCNLEATVIDMRGLDLRGVDLRLGKLVGADFSGARLDGALLNQADLRKISFHGASLHRVNFVGANLAGADFGSAKGAKANLRKTNLTGADLRRAELPGADIGQSTMVNARLDGANLRGAVLEKSDLSQASLTKANLTGANLRNTVLKDARFDGATVAGADLGEAMFERTSLKGVDMSSAVGLGAAELTKLENDSAQLPVTRALPKAAMKQSQQRAAAAPEPAVTAQESPELTDPARPKKEIARAPSAEPAVQRAPSAKGRGSAPTLESADAPPQAVAKVGLTKGGYKVQLGSYRSEKIAQATRGRVMSEYHDILGRAGVELDRIDYGGSRGIWHRLRTGAVSTRREAQALCASLKQRTPSVGCLVVR